MTQRSLPEFESLKIKENIRDDLLEHLYKGAPVGVSSGILASLSIYTIAYSKEIQSLLLFWLVVFNLDMLYIAILYVFYKKNRYKFGVLMWEVAIYTPLIFCTFLYGMSIFFSPTDVLHQFSLMMILFLVALAFSMATVGTFKLGVVCISFVLLPISGWCLWHNDLFYRVLGGFILVILYFLIGMNYKSSTWLKNSLKLKIENTLTSYQATHDIITDLPNKRIFLKNLEEAINRIKGSKKKLLLVCFSINRVELFNNSYGYQAGDTIIYSVAQRLKSFLEEQSKADPSIQRDLTLPRPNAFSVIYEPMELNNIQTEIDKLFLILRNPLRLNESNATLTASAGYAVYPDHGEDPVTLLKNAHVAMFQASKSGGNQTMGYYPALNSNAPKSLELEIDLHSAVKNDEFVLYYQPIINIKTDTLDSMECLLRWKHPKLGLILPMEFISITEETGLIIPVGKLVLEQACFQMMQWQKQGLYTPPFKIAVNVSVRQLHDEEFVVMVEGILAKTGMPAEWLEIEITETQLADEKIIPPIKALIDKGISLSMDDYGTGYSGMHYLRLFKFNKIKIDREFITDIITNINSMILVESIIDLGNRVGVKVLAEGVETKEQLDVLIKMGCDYVQGYYFSKPLSAADTTQFLVELSTKLKQALRN